MEEHELGITALFNEYFAGLANWILSLVGLTAKDPTKPWENWIVVELIVVALLVLVVALVRSSLSPEKPGKLQQLFEMIQGFIADTIHQVGVHDGEKYVPYVGTVFLFILSMNLIGIIPAFESPTMAPWVPAGMAIATFLYFNVMGFRAHGIKYLGHFAGPVRFASPFWTFLICVFMLPIETISIFIRPLSLTVRLYGNMFAGEQVTLVFLSLTKLVVPVIFMALHVFVAIVQAYVFTLLTIIYVDGATSHEH
jgi:F-type H+-transporting ATPase subunit a